MLDICISYFQFYRQTGSACASVIESQVSWGISLWAPLFLFILLVPHFVVHSSIFLWQTRIMLTRKSNKNKVFNVFLAFFNVL